MPELIALEDIDMSDAIIHRPIATLVCRDIPGAVDYLTRAFGLGPGEVSTTPDGDVVHGSIDVGAGTVWLHPESSDHGLAAPASVDNATATMVVLVDDVDQHHAHAVANEATISYEPTDQPYGYREYGAVDSEGHLWSFMKPID